MFGYIHAKTAFASKDNYQKYFKTPEEAVKALLTACKSDDAKMMLDIFGHKHKNLVVTSDKAREKMIRVKFHKMAGEMNKLEKNKDGSFTLLVGKDGWPLPIPLVKEAKGWRFNTEAGEEEIINRRIGENELKAIAVCLAYWEAQQEYFEKDRDTDEVLEYAQKFVSSEGKKDGLYWPVDPKSGEELSPFGPIAAKSQEYIEHRKEAGTPFFGYYYKILTGQGANAPGGKHSYIINGNMIAGFALVAYPADYGSSGVMTFVVNHQGKAYEKDLGKDTAKIVGQMKEYNLDKTWKLIEEK
ncbi:MAG: DUF2950 domain-containing protein [Candidatus Eremiobacteraeota bacterium]|nr:DUF2950 domain-containing protein [Candidatus Eremiobacteraeota bacterium]